MVRKEMKQISTCKHCESLQPLIKNSISKGVVRCMDLKKEKPFTVSTSSRYWKITNRSESLILLSDFTEEQICDAAVFSSVSNCKTKVVIP